MIRYTSAQVLISKPSGEILWANPAFCEWSKYSVNELTKLKWQQISVPDDDLAADIAAAGQLSEYNLSYTVQKRYIPKNDKPQLGNLHVTRYPATGPIEFCFCRWEPLVNGTAQAFELALESQKRLAQQMEEMTTQIKALTSQTEEQRFTLSLVTMITRYPKTALGILVVAMSIGGFDAVLNTLQRLGFVTPPPVIVQELKK